MLKVIDKLSDVHPKEEASAYRMAEDTVDDLQAILRGDDPS